MFSCNFTILQCPRSFNWVQEGVWIDTVAGIHKVCGQALGFNTKSIQFHKSLGFAQEGILKDHYYDGEDFDDLFCFGLTRPIWPNNRERK